MANGSIQTINISTSTIFRVIIILLGFIFLYLIRDILLLVFIAIVIAAAINGPVSWLQTRRVPRLLGVIFVYLFLLLVLALMTTLIFPPLAEQIKQLATYFPDFLSKSGIGLRQWWFDYSAGANFQDILGQLSEKITQATRGVFSTIIDLFGGIFSAFVVLVISFYLTLQEKGIKKFLVSLTPSEHQYYLSDLIERIQVKIGSWLRAQVLLMAIIGLLTFLGLYFLGIKYALTLGLLAGLLEIIPYLGPILAAIPAVILGFFQSPWLALLVAVLYIVIQQLENYIIVPQVMKRSVGLNPIVIIIVMLIGAKLAGILGIILSVPLTASLAEFFRSLKEAENNH